MKMMRADLVSNSEGCVYRIAYDTERNTLAESDIVWSNIKAQWALEMEHNWYVDMLGYSTVLFFIKLNGLFDPDYKSKVAFLEKKAAEIMAVALAD